MARLVSIGFELNSMTNDVEVSSWSNGSIQTTTVRSGTYADEKTTSVTVQNTRHTFKASDTADGFYLRMYVRFAAFPGTNQQTVFEFMDSGLTRKISIRVNTNGTLELWNEEDATQVGSDSSALSLNTWYRLELKTDCTTLASTAIEAKIDGTSFASGTINLANGFNQFRIGPHLAADSASNVFFDDIAINDDSGSFQNSYPGEGEIIHLRPNADTANSDFTPLSGVDNYAMVDEVTPDDVTTYNLKSAAGGTDDFDLEATPAALASDDTINVVQVGARFRTNSTVGTNPIIVLRCVSGGTAEESGNITLNSTTWSTNAMAAPRNYALTLYDLPGASSTAWDKTTLDAAQAGYRLTNASTGQANISTVWLLVDHKPAAGGGGGGSTQVPTRMMLGIGY